MMLKNESKISIRTVILVFCIFANFSIQGCTINHYIAKDYPQYLKEKNVSIRANEKLEEAFYQLTDGTKNSEYHVQAMASGWAQIWVVQFGDVLKSYLESRNPLSKHWNLRSVAQNEKIDELFIFDLKKYSVSHGTVHIDLYLQCVREGKEFFSKIYSEKGEDLFGKMSLGGAFVMRTVLQQSTTSALDVIFNKILVDLKFDNKSEINEKRLTPAANRK